MQRAPATLTKEEKHWWVIEMCELYRQSPEVQEILEMTRFDREDKKLQREDRIQREREQEARIHFEEMARRCDNPDLYGQDDSDFDDNFDDPLGDFAASVDTIY